MFSSRMERPAWQCVESSAFRFRWPGNGWSVDLGSASLNAIAVGCVLDEICKSFRVLVDEVLSVARSCIGYPVMYPEHRTLCIHEVLNAFDHNTYR